MIKASVGCGKRDFGVGWINIDGGKFDHVFSHGVFLKEYPDDAFDLIYSSHLIAYFDRDEVMKLLSYWYKKLKPGGTLRIATPDCEFLFALYEQGVELDKLLGPLYGKMKMGDKTIYHKTTYNFASIINVLSKAGFKRINIYDHKETDHAQFDDHSAAYINDTLISLNVECTK